MHFGIKLVWLYFLFKEQLERHLDREGNTNTVFNFLNDLRRRDDWVNHLLRALWNCEHRELYYTLRDEYRLLRPKSGK